MLAVNTTPCEPSLTQEPAVLRVHEPPNAADSQSLKQLRSPLPGEPCKPGPSELVSEADMIWFLRRNEIPEPESRRPRLASEREIPRPERQESPDRLDKLSRIPPVKGFTPVAVLAVREMGSGSDRPSCPKQADTGGDIEAP